MPGLIHDNIQVTLLASRGNGNGGSAFVLMLTVFQAVRLQKARIAFNGGQGSTQFVADHRDKVILHTINHGARVFAVRLWAYSLLFRLSAGSGIFPLPAQ